MSRDSRHSPPVVASKRVANGHQTSQGRAAHRAALEDRLAPQPSVVTGKPKAAEFLKTVHAEMRIRFYQPKTIKSYTSAAKSFLRWFGNDPHLACRDDVKNYLLYLVDAGAASGTVSNHLSGIRLLFDRFCNQAITEGLVTPRKPKRWPIPLSKQEIVWLLEAATSLRDKLLLGLMYATGLRISEVVRLRWRDIDFDRNSIFVRQGKGRSDRMVVLPESYRTLFRELSAKHDKEDHLFPGQRKGRYMSPRTVQRIMQRTLQIAGINKRATPHSLRHSFATHSFEDGHDIRRIQKLLGHARLETTTIYVKVAQPSDPSAFTSPIDRLPSTDDKGHISNESSGNQTSPSCIAEPRDPSGRESVGAFRVHLQQQCSENGQRVAKVTLEITSESAPTFLLGIIAREVRTGFVTLQIPPLETWRPKLDKLPIAQRERIEEAEFYLMLQQQIASKVARLPHSIQ